MRRHVLIELMQKASINEADLAKASGVPQPTVHRIIKGATPDPRVSTLVQLARYFDVTIGQLIGEEPIFADVEDAELHSAKIPVIAWDEPHKWHKLIKSLTIQNWRQWIIANADLGPNAYALKVHFDSAKPLFPKNSVLIIDPDKPMLDNSYIIARLAGNERASIKQLIIDGDEKWLTDPKQKIPPRKMQPEDVYCGTIKQTCNSF